MRFLIRSTLVVIVTALLSSVFIFFNLNHISAQSRTVCTGFDSQLNKGERAQVTPGLNNNVRARPNTSASLLGQISAGQVVEVIDGPRCRDGLTWWKIDDTEGLEGWTVEGRGDDRWLVRMERTSNDKEQGSDRLEILRGLGVFVGGGGGSVCGFDDLEVFATYNDGNNRYRISSGENITVDLNQYTDMYSYHAKSGALPLICIRHRPQVLRAISPSGEQMSTDHISLYKPPEDYTPFWEVQLPLWAYLEPGEWQFQVDTFSLNIVVGKPDHPVIFGSVAEFVLMGFQPRERVLLVNIIDRETGAYSVEEITVGNFGELYKEVSVFLTIEAVIGESSGALSTRLIPWDTDRASPAYSIPEKNSAAILYSVIWENQSVDLTQWACPNALTTRLTGRQPVTSISEVNIYALPTIDSPIIATFPGGTRFHLGGGVYCADNATWWATPVGDFETGYIRESQDGTYLLEPSP